MRIIKGVFLFAVLAFSCFLPEASCQPESQRTLYVFHSPGCHKCLKAKNETIPAVEKKFKGVFSVEYFDISEMAGYEMMLGLRDKFSPGLKIEVPVFFMNGKMLSGANLTQLSLEDFIVSAVAVPATPAGPLMQTSLMERFKGIKLATIVSLGLVDGINPCAFTVIVFFISFLALQGYVKRELAVIGSCFILAVFITYILIGLGAFTFLYRLREFWLISRLINYSVGSFSIAVGCLALYDYFKFKKTGQTEGLKLQLPKAVKDQIHKVIAGTYRVNKNSPSGINKRRIGALIISALATGFLVTLLEAVCTGQTYLPTLTFILKTTSLKAHALAYLLIYNLMFILPLAVILILALLGATSEQFAGFLKKHLLKIKFLMAALFFALGIFLFWRA
ncbi:MAG: hypothetical protein WC532_00120 [Candidatus Omnitrophota bacterium]